MMRITQTIDTVIVSCGVLAVLLVVFVVVDIIVIVVCGWFYRWLMTMMDGGGVG